MTEYGAPTDKVMFKGEDEDTRLITDATNCANMFMQKGLATLDDETRATVDRALEESPEGTLRVVIDVHPLGAMRLVADCPPRKPWVLARLIGTPPKHEVN